MDFLGCELVGIMVTFKVQTDGSAETSVFLTRLNSLQMSLILESVN